MRDDTSKLVFRSRPPNKGFSMAVQLQFVMAARVAEIKIVRGAECTKLIRKFQCFVASSTVHTADVVAAASVLLCSCSCSRRL